MAWDPAQYQVFREQREAPFVDLLALAQFHPGQRIIDLGCGTGDLTARLAALVPESRVVGIDSSTTMQQQAQKLVHPRLQFRLGRIEEFIDGTLPDLPTEPADVLFSHAALQWVDDHPALFARLIERLPPSGQLLVQMPSNSDHVSHRIVREVVASEPFRSALQGYARRSPVLSIADYAELLFRLGIPRPIVIEKVYAHTLADSQAVLQWVRGTLLVPYLERLPTTLHDDFLRVLGQRFAQALPDRPCFYGFRRILIAAQRPAAS